MANHNPFVRRCQNTTGARPLSSRWVPACSDGRDQGWGRRQILSVAATWQQQAAAAQNGAVQTVSLSDSFNRGLVVLNSNKVITTILALFISGPLTDEPRELEFDSYAYMRKSPKKPDRLSS